MKNSLFYKVLISLVFVSGILKAEESRNEQEQIYTHPRVLQAFNRVMTTWDAYALTDPEFPLNKLVVALEFAGKQHVGQWRKDEARTPYIVHPIGVSELLWNVGGVRDGDILIAALLHDTLEDTEATPAEVEALFGKQVLRIVEELTNDPSLSTAENKQRQIDHAPQMSQGAKLIKLADRIYNINDLYTSPPLSWSEEHIAQYIGWGIKLREALKGTNAPLEAHFDQLVSKS